MPDVTGGAADLTGRLPSQRRERSIRLIAILLLALVSIVSAELGARAFWRIKYHVPLRHPSRILYAYYPPLRWIDETRPTRGNGSYDILLLGGSSLNPAWGPVQAALAEELAYRGHRNVHIYNLAWPAHTSRDSWLKYAALGTARFDLVLVYDGINDTRANNAPPGIFREDYGHYSWYEMVNTLASYHGTATFALPYTLHYLALNVRQALRKDRYVPTADPRPEWVQYGRDPRSAVSFERNLQAILDLAERRGDRVMVMTFATYVPDHYSLEAFEQKRLGYGLHFKPIEDWGRREYVVKAVEVQNEAVRRLAAQHKGVLLVDQARLMAASPRYFNDPCHFTVVGATRFVENVVAALLPTLPRR
jgi:hypothetical protein